MIFNRNKVHNGSHLLTVMADVYDLYLRLLDVILKKDSSSRTASSLIPMDKVQHVSGAEYRVQGSDSLYSVDLAVGMCSCPAGDTGAICKHQLAASQFSAVKLPQMYGCSPTDKYLLSKIIVYGDRTSYGISFFTKLGDETRQASGVE